MKESCVNAMTCERHIKNQMSSWIHGPTSRQGCQGRDQEHSNHLWWYRCFHTANVLLIFQRLQLDCSLTMESTGSERTLINIGACVESHKGIIPELLGAHALTGCDTVAQCFGIGKATAMKILKSGHFLQSLGEVHIGMEDIRQNSWLPATEALRETVCLTCALMYGQRKWQDERSQQLLSWKICHPPQRLSRWVCGEHTFKRQYGNPHVKQNRRSWIQLFMAGNVMMFLNHWSLCNYPRT